MMKLGLLEKFVGSRKNTLPENIVICAAIALAGTFYNYEYFYGSTVHSVVCLLITAFLAAAWIICAAFNGKDGKIGFLIFSFLYWSIPYIYVLWYESRDNLRDYNKYLAAINKITKAVLYNPFAEAAKKIGSSPIILAFILLITVMVAYIAGFLINRFYSTKTEKSKDFDYDGEYEIDDDDDPEEDDSEEADNISEINISSIDEDLK